MALSRSTACTLPILLLLLICSFSGGMMMVEGCMGSMNKFHPLNKDDGFQVNSRKLMVHDTILDYDYPGPNPKHDPKKGKPGIGGKNIP